MLARQPVATAARPAAHSSPACRSAWRGSGRRGARRPWLWLASCLALGTPGAQGAWLAWKAGDGNHRLNLQGSEAPPAAVPLGSLWKLYVYAYVVENKLATPAYRCDPRARAAVALENDFCCKPGESVERDAALGRSCGAFFDPKRLNIQAADWQRYWQQQGMSQSWLRQLDHLRPNTLSSIDDILDSLDQLPGTAKQQAGQALLGTLFEGQGQALLPWTGGALRVKSYTWGHPTKPGTYFGGAAGWMLDGTAIWIGGTGSSRSVLRQVAPRLPEALPPMTQRALAGSCVRVPLFSRYPIRRVNRAGTQEAARPGTLRGQFDVLFERGTQASLRADGDVLLAQQGTTIGLTATWNLDEYVARVVDREGDARQTQAAQALAVAARTYVLQEGVMSSGCYTIADSSRTQRVSPVPPSAAARQVAWNTADLLLDGVAVRYHLDQAAPNQLSWQLALLQSRAGLNYLDILQRAYPRSTLSSMAQHQACRRLPEAEQWLAQAAGQWHPQLRTLPGYEPLPEPAAVCRLAHGHPYSNQQNLRIYVRGWRDWQDRLTLAHEYLHLAFRFHPHGGDEAWVEQMARKLVGG